MKFTTYLLGGLLCLFFLTTCKKSNDPKFDGRLSLDQPTNQTTLPSESPIEFKFSTNKEVPAGYQLSVYSIGGETYLRDEEFSGQEKTVEITFRDKGTELVYGQLVKEKDTLNSNFVEINVICAIPVTLEPMTSDNNFITLQWTKSDAPNFGRYVIFRNQFQAPDEYTSSHTIFISDQNQTSYTDEVEFMDRNYYYAVAVETAEDCFSFSNVERIEPGNFLRLNTALQKILADPSRDYVYAIAEDSKIKAFDLNNMEQTAEYDPGYQVEDFDISDDRQYLYLSANDFNQKQIIQLSLPDLNLVNTIPTEDSPFKIEVGPRYIYYQRKPPTSGNSPLKRIEISTGIESGFGNSRHGDIELSSDGKYLFHVEGNTSAPSLFRIETSFGNRIEQDRLSDFNNSYLAIADNDAYICHSDRLYDKDLNFVRAASDILLDISSDGNLVLHRQQEVLNVNGFTKAYDAPAIFELGAFGKDDNYLILYVAPNNSTYSDGKIFRVNL